MVDFFVPSGNEEEFAKAAKEIGVDEFVFLYSFKDYKKKLSGEYETGVIFEDEVSISMVRKAVQLSDYVVVKAYDNLREVLEKNKRIYVYGLELGEQKDFVHFRNSGLNHVLVKIAKDNKIKFLFNFSEFLSLNPKKRGVVLGRLKQNIELFKKYKVEFSFASFANSKFNIKKGYGAIQKLLESNKLDLI